MPYPNEHACRLQDPGKFDPQTFRRTHGSGNGRVQGVTVPESIDVIWGKLKRASKPADPVVAQALRFPVKNWTEAAARKWISDNGIKGSFEPAAKERSQSIAPAADVMISDFTFSAHDGVSIGPDVIKGVAVVSEGEAKGHGVWLDQDFVRKVIDHGNATGTHGVKARFGHPTMSGSALGSFIGRFKNFREDRGSGGAVARADLYMSNSAKDTPNGDLHSYVMNLAAEDPKAFGASIVFTPGPKYAKDEKGTRLDPEAAPAGAKVFVEMAQLRAADLVDDPAANPDGLFSAFNRVTWAGQVTEFLDCHPHVFRLLEENPAVIAGFMTRYKAYLERKGQQMPAELEGTQIIAAEAADNAGTEAPEGATEGDTPTPDQGQGEGKEAPTVAQDDQPQDDAAPAAADEPDAADDQQQDTPAAEAEPMAQAAKPEGLRFLEAFGDQGGVWFAKGLTFEQAQAEYMQALKAENADLKQRIAALQEAGAKPVSFDDKPQRPAGDFLTQAKALAKAEGISVADACSRLATEQPTLYAEYKKGKAPKATA